MQCIYNEKIIPLQNSNVKQSKISVIAVDRRGRQQREGGRVFGRVKLYDHPRESPHETVARTLLSSRDNTAGRKKGREGGG